MTSEREGLARILAWGLLTMGSICTGGIVLLTAMKCDVPPALTHIAIGIAGALGGALYIPGKPQVKSNGTHP